MNKYHLSTFTHTETIAGPPLCTERHPSDIRRLHNKVLKYMDSRVKDLAFRLILEYSPALILPSFVTFWKLHDHTKPQLSHL